MDNTDFHGTIDIFLFYKEMEHVFFSEAHAHHVQKHTKIHNYKS